MFRVLGFINSSFSVAPLFIKQLLPVRWQFFDVLVKSRTSAQETQSTQCSIEYCICHVHFEISSSHVVILAIFHYEQLVLRAEVVLNKHGTINRSACGREGDRRRYWYVRTKCGYGHSLFDQTGMTWCFSSVLCCINVNLIGILYSQHFVCLHSRKLVAKELWQWMGKYQLFGFWCILTPLYSKLGCGG